MAFLYRTGTRQAEAPGVEVGARPECPCPFPPTDRIGESGRRLVDSAGEAVVMVDATGTIELANARAERLFGYAPQELVGLSVAVLVPERLRKGHDARCRSYSAQPRLREMGTGTEFFGCRKDGTEFPAEISLCPSETRQGTFVLASIRDITARKHADYLASHFMAVVESSNDAIIGTDLDGGVTSWNPGAELLFGYAESDMLGQPISVLDPAGDDGRWIEQIFEAVEKQDTTRLRKDGTLVNVSITHSPIRGSDGALRGFSTIARDISDRRKSETLKGGFLSMVSHELRTPLSAIVAYVELLIDGELSRQERDRFTEVIHRNSLRLERLVGDLLFVAQLESASFSITKSIVDVVAIAREAVDAAMPRAEQSGVDLHLAPCKDSLSLIGDAGRLGQALDNLISNAIKYSPDGGAVCVTVLPGAGECTIEVQDHGMGIAHSEQKHLFERFFRASKAVDLQIQGVGLGLMVVEAIVDAHDGSVSVLSEPGSGATFRVTIPLEPQTQRPVPSPVPTLTATHNS